MVSPSGSRKPSPPEATISKSMPLNDYPPVFDWDRWGEIRSKDETEEMVSPSGSRKPSPLEATISKSMPLNDYPPVFDWDRWGEIRSEDENEEMVSPSGSRKPSPPEATISKSMPLNDYPPVFDWDRWGEIRSEDESEEMVSPSGSRSPASQPAAAVSSSMPLNDYPPVFDWDRWGEIRSEDENEEMVSPSGSRSPASQPAAAVSSSMPLNDYPPVFDWDRWGEIRSEDENEEMVSPSGSRSPASQPAAAVSSSMPLNDYPPVFDWDRWGEIRSESEDFRGTEEMESPSHVVSHTQLYLPVIGSGGRSHGVGLAEDEPPVFDWDRSGEIPVIDSGRLCHGVDVVDPDEAMEPFDMETFVDRLVEDGPPAKAGYICDAPVAADTPPEVATTSGNSHPSNSSSAAKLFLQPIRSQSWPEQRPAASAQGAEWRRADDKPSVVPNDTFPDALFFPARISSPEIVAAVEPGFVMTPILDSNDGGIRSGIAGFEPSAISDIPPLVEPLPVERQVPSALARSDYDDIPLPSPGAKPVSSAVQIQLQKQKHCDGTTHLEVWNNVLDNPISTGDAPAPTRLIGADDDDDRYTFPRQQESVHQVGPGYLAGFGQPGVVDGSQRTALVNHISRLHAAAPAASGGGPPLSLGTIFLALNLLDQFLSTDEGGRVAFAGRGGLKVASAACLGITSKYEGNQSVATSLWGLAIAGTRGETQTVGANDDELHAARKDLAAMELRVLSSLSYRLTVPTALSFLEELVRRASLLGYLPQGPAAETVRVEAQQILLRVLRDDTWLEHMPSALAAAALYRASRTSSPGAAPPSSSAFFAITGYRVEILCRCLRDMEAVRTGGGGTGRRDGGLGFG